METVFVPFKYKKKLSKGFMEKIAKIACDNVGIFTTIQFVNQLGELEEFLKNNGKHVFVGTPTYRAVERGQTLGCDTTAPLSVSKDVDCFVYLGSGFFHSVSVSLESGKPVYQANPITGVVNLLDEGVIRRYKLLRKDAIAKARSAKIYGILVCTKPGQYNLNLAEKIKNKLEAEGKKAYIFMFETMSPESLLDFQDIEAWISTACPRIAVDDIERFDRPIINPGDL